MASSRQVIFDSDDDGDDLSPLSSPLTNPHLSPSPSHLSEPSLPPPPPPLPFSANPVDTSTSTDPSFFRNIYEEQQRALGAQLHAAMDDNGQETRRDASDRDIGRNPWEVPRSPIEVVGQQREVFLKRKRECDPSRNNVSVVVQLDDLSSGGAGPAKRQKRAAETTRPRADDDQIRQQEADELFSSPAGSDGGGGGLEISIPLEPMTPSRMHQYPRLLSSSINEDLTAHDESLPRIGLGLQAAPTHQTPYDHLPSEAVTESTIAFTTPSLYASSGRRALGSSSNNNNNSGNNILKQIKSSSHDMDVVKETIAAANATPPRRIRKAADLAQIMSSPDIIAEPACPREPQRHQSPLIEADEEEDDVWEVHSARKGKNMTKSIRRRSRRSSVADELSINIDEPAQDEGVHETDESDASISSPPRKAAISRKAVSKVREKSAGEEVIFIAASDDEDGIDVAPLSPAESESDFSDALAKSNAKVKSKRRPKKKESTTVPVNNAILSFELQDQVHSKPKRPRGRPKQQKNAKQEEEVLDSDDMVEIKAELPKPNTEEPTAEPEAEADVKAEPDAPKLVKEKGKKGSRGRKGAKAAVTAAPSELASQETALSEMSGNAAAVNLFKGEKKKEEDEKEDQKAIAAKEEPPLPSYNKPTTAVTGLTTGLGTGLNTSSQGRVPYRVGLSKKLRIAPLLKMIRK